MAIVTVHVVIFGVLPSTQRLFLVVMIDYVFIVVHNAMAAHDYVVVDLVIHRGVKHRRLSISETHDRVQAIVVGYRSYLYVGSTDILMVVFFVDYSVHSSVTMS